MGNTRRVIHAKKQLSKLYIYLELREEVHHIRVGAKKDVEAGLDPISVGVLPSGHLATEYMTSLVHHRHVARVREVLGTRQPGETAAKHCDALRVAALFRGELRRELSGLAVVGCLLDPRWCRTSHRHCR